ncbi:MAG: two pore domain potassium channel family protein [Actinobacteria bacterium]|nr:MAG: two pore domain potassium channel family protein [Actinomycetota bacterium]
MRRLLHFINDVSLGWLIAAMAITILAFGFGYYTLAQAGPGYLHFTYQTEARPTLADSLYFSIVTISSLGYGDIRPEGPTRLLVSLEVIMGLAFFGLLVAKISSVKQDYILRQMYAGVLDEKLARYSAELDERRTLYRTTSTLLLEGEIDPGLTTTFRRDTPGATFFTSYRQLLTDVTDLMETEASNSALFGVVDDSRIESIYDAVRGVLRRTTLMWDDDGTTACDLVLCDNGPDIALICDASDRLAALGRRESRNKEILGLCDAIRDLSKRVRAEIVPAL